MKPTPWLASPQNQQCVRIERGTAVDLLRQWRRLRVLHRNASPWMRTYSTSTLDRGILLIPTRKGETAVRFTDKATS